MTFGRCFSPPELTEVLVTVVLNHWLYSEIDGELKKIPMPRSSQILKLFILCDFQCAPVDSHVQPRLRISD